MSRRDEESQTAPGQEDDSHAPPAAPMIRKPADPLPTRPVCALTIAGSDPSGGAGVQTDLRVFDALGVVGLSAITALTVQNSQGVLAVHPVPADVLYDQIEAVLEDTRPAPAAVKIGMLGGAEQARAVVAALRRFRPPNVVLDPVLASTGGVLLLDEPGRQALVQELLPLCDLVTPNLAEAGFLAGFPLANESDMERAARQVLRMGARACLVKGGHLEGAPIDVLVGEDGHLWLFDSERIDTTHTHGTGCFLSAAVAAGLAIGEPLAQAVGNATGLLRSALRTPVTVGAGRGFPDAQAGLRRHEYDTMPHLSILNRIRGLYVLTDSRGDVRTDHRVIVEAALDGGANVIQLREKQADTRSTIALATCVRRAVHARRGLLLVNDRVDVALASGADGVHLGPDDMHPADARQILAADKLIGVSVSSVEEAAPLAPYASYFGVGAIFGSSTKPDAGPPVGVERIREIKAAFPNHPVVAIGGITAGNIALVAAAGADAAAVISAVVCAPDMRAAVEDLRHRFEASCPGASPANVRGESA